MSASNQPTTDTGKVLTLQGRKPVPSRLAELGGGSEADVLPIATVAKSAVETVHTALPASNHPAAVVLPNSQGGSNIPLDKTAETAITELLDKIQAANSQAACLWLRAGDYSVIEGIHGHEAGVRLMERVEARLSQCLREDDLVCRLTSNEFVIVLKDVGDRDTAGDVAARLLKQCNGVYRTAGVSFHLQCSAGVTLYPSDAAEPYQLLRYARMALPESSSNGPHEYRLFSTQLLAGLRDRVWMSVELEGALEQDRLVLHYQPQYAIDTQRVVAVEALVRLVTTSGELIAPNEFIELAEQTGQILPLGRWVIEEACQQLGRWQRAGGGRIRMAVNVSPCQLMADDFCAVVEAAVSRAGIRHSDLELEITECQLVENLSHVEQTLRALTAKGVRIAVDDFGTGYSSLAYLMQLSINTVKVDRAFVSRITDDVRAARIVNVIIALARELGLALTAEGIETEAQHRLLLESQCQVGQGYGFARPQSAQAIQRFLV